MALCLENVEITSQRHKFYLIILLIMIVAFHNMGFYQYTKELYVEASFSLEESLKVRQSIGKLDAGSAQSE